MKCQHVQKQLFHYIDGELSSKTSKQLRGHLETCIICEQKYRHYEETHNALKDFGHAVQTGEIVVQPPPLPELGKTGLWKRFIRGLKTPVPVWIPSAVSLVVLLIFIGVISLPYQSLIELSREKGASNIGVVTPPFAAEMMLEFLIVPSPTNAGQLAASVETVETFLLAHPDDLAMHAKLIELYKAQLRLEVFSNDERFRVAEKLEAKQGQFLELLKKENLTKGVQNGEE